jgi:hypothetical protein
MCGAPRSGQSGWSTCTPSRVHIPDVLSAIMNCAMPEATRDGPASRARLSCQMMIETGGILTLAYSLS